MAYRNGTYIAFHAAGTNLPGKSDIDYYNLMKAWSAKTDDDFTMINSHDKASAVRDTSKKATLRASLLERLRNSRNMVLIVGQTTRFDTDWVPLEIEKAIDIYSLPLIAAYTDYSYIISPANLRSLWPAALTKRIDSGLAKIIHIPFKKAPLMEAINQFNHNNLPSGSLGYYSLTAYGNWGLLS